MMKRLFKVIVLAVSFFAISAHAESLTFVEYTRLIFNGTQKAVSFPLKNDTTFHYLVKGSVRNLQGNEPGPTSQDFLVLPEVLLLEPGKHQELRIVRIGGQYPTDRESVFFVNGVFVPEKHNQSTTGLNLAISLNVKMFYRPESIIDKAAIKQVAKQLKFTLTPQQLHVQNPTPYYATFSALSVDSYSLKNEQLKVMVPPFGESHYSIQGIGLKTGKISWSLIDEWGNDTEMQVKEVRVQK